MDAHGRGFPVGTVGLGESMVFLERSRKEREESLSSPLFVKLQPLTDACSSKVAGGWWEGLGTGASGP